MKKIDKIFGLYATVFIISVSLLMLEILLTRYSKIAFGYNFQFILISLVILGIGAGSMLVYFVNAKKKQFFESNLHQIIIVLSFLYSILIFTPFLILHYTWIVSPILVKTLFFLLSFIVFLIWGVIISIIFMLNAEHVSKLYFFNLLGSGLGGFVAVYSLNRLGNEFTLLVLFSISVLAIISYCLFNGIKSKLIFLLALVVIMIFVFYPDFIPYFRVMCGAQEPLFSESNSYSQIDTYECKNCYTNDKKIYLSVRKLLIDCRGHTTFINFDPNQKRLGDKPINDLFYAMKNYSHALIIGSGGGIDVVKAVLAKVNKVTAVEINPLTINRVKELTKENPSLNVYNYKSVNLVMEEGRNFISKSSDKYDLIYLTNAKSYGSLSLSSYALLENYLYTQEAFKDYFDHLTNEGVLTIFDWEMYIQHYTSNGIIALKNYGINPNNKVAVVKGRVAEGRDISIVILKKSDFTDSEKRLLTKKSKGSEFSIKFLDADAINAYIDNAVKITDDRPYISTEGRWAGIKPKPPFNSLFFTLAIVFLSFVIFLLLPFYFNRNLKSRTISSLLFYFSFIGIGFILFELALINKFTLFVTHPIYAISVVLSSLLFFAGIGSYMTNHVTKDFKSSALKIVLVLSFIMLLFTFFLTPLLNKLLPFSLTGRIILSVIIIAVPSVFMGMLFPIGLKMVNNISRDLIPWMWGINGIASVLGGVLSMIISVFFGSNTSLIIGIVFYMMAAATIKS